MAITQQRFLGATIRSIKSSMGLGSQGSQLSLNLIVDPDNGDSFNPPIVGSPVYFSYGSLSFNGLLQKAEQNGDINGKPLYDVVVVDPRDILEGAQIIISAYAGGVGNVSNLFNAFGWYESFAFGASLSNDAGMPWVKIRDAVLSMCNGGGGPYGSSLKFQGVSYGLDLSQLPTPPIYYRMSGTNIGLLEAITQICEDGGCDFFVELVGYTIKIRTISRLNQPPLGTISSIVNSSIGTTIRSSNGLELRNEITSSFLVGGEQTRLNLSDNIYQFFGYDINGYPIVGFPTTVTLTSMNGSSLGQMNCLQMSLNASEIADILGSAWYNTTTIELRLAKGCDYNAWAAFMYHYRRPLAESLGITAIYVNGSTSNYLNRSDIVNDTAAHANAMIASQLSSDANVRSLRVFDFIRNVADEYLGRKYLVSIPFITSYQDPETLKIIKSYDVSGEGAYLPEGSSPLGLSPLNEDIFKNQDGRFRTFVEYTGIGSADLSSISPQGTVVENGSLFVEAQPDSNVVYYNGYPFALLTLPCALYAKASDSMGGSTAAAGAALQLNPAAAADLLRNAYLGGIRIAPDVYTPSFAAVPLRSNIFTYGPWYFAGVSGKVKFEYDPSMTPWNYGNYGVMNLAGNCRVANAVTNMLISESGQIEFAGAPQYTLGDIMQSGGPNITNIDVQFSTEGVTSTYRFQTFTPKFGVFSRGNAERMKRLSLTNVSLRRSIRAALRNNLVTQGVLNTAKSTKTFMQNAPKAMKRETPNDTFVSYSFYDPDTQTTRMSMQTATYEEAVSLSNADESTKYRETAIMGMNGLFRPFSVSTAASNNIPSFSEPTIVRGCPCKTTLNPFASSNDIEVYSWGPSYSGLNAFRRGGDVETARAVALRGPVIIAGFGYNLKTQQVPKSTTTNSYANDYLTRQEKWKVGPLDPLWDDERGVWTCHGILKGETGGKFPANGSGLFKITPNQNGGNEWTMTAWNYFSSEVSGSLKAFISYFPQDNRWYLTSVDCSGS